MGIGADEEIVVAVAVGRDIVLDHFLDDTVLFPPLPPRHENGDPPLGRGIELGFGKPAKLRPPRQAGRQPRTGAGKVDEQIIEAVQEQP